MTGVWVEVAVCVAAAAYATLRVEQARAGERQATDLHAAARAVSAPAVPLGWITRLRSQGVTITDAEQFGPQGSTHRITAADGEVGSLIITQADALDGNEWLHASIAYRDRDPSYLEVAALHRAVFGRRRWAYLPFAPAVEHVSIHAHALHLFGRVDGAAALPDFTRGTGSI